MLRLRSRRPRVFRSHPARGEWIEISCRLRSASVSRCLTPRGVSGLKYFDWLNVQRLRSLTPRGVSGLKSPPCRMSLRRSTRQSGRLEVDETDVKAHRIAANVEDVPFDHIFSPRAIFNQELLCSGTSYKRQDTILSCLRCRSAHNTSHQTGWC